MRTLKRPARENLLPPQAFFSPAAAPLARPDLEAAPLSRSDPMVGGSDATGSGGWLENRLRQPFAAEGGGGGDHEEGGG